MSLPDLTRLSIPTGVWGAPAGGGNGSTRDLSASEMYDRRMRGSLKELILASSPTGVKLLKDGKAKLTREEWKKVKHLLKQPPASAPAAAPKERGRLRVIQESSSDSEENTSLSYRVKKPPNGQGSSSGDRSNEHYRTNTPSHGQGSDSDEDTPLSFRIDKRSNVKKRMDQRKKKKAVRGDRLPSLGEDELANILSLIRNDNNDKLNACSDALAWCSVSKAHENASITNPGAWKNLINRIFQYGDVGKDNDSEESLIYRTFKNDGDPRKAFISMCRAYGLGDTLAKRFVSIAINEYEDMLDDNFVEEGSNITGLGEEFDDVLNDPKRRKETAEEIFPDLAYTEEWANNAKKLFNAAPCKARFDKNYVKNPTFYKIVNFIFKSTINYLFKDPNAINQLVDSTPFINAIYNIGRVLGVYITCLWKLEEKRQNEIDNKNIQNLRVNIYYEVNKILDPGFMDSDGEDGEDEEFKLELELYNYESDASESDSD